MLSVTDTGAGMDELTQLKIFDPFFSTKGEGGTGLGLATVYGIVRQTGGSISVTSKVGEGTVFKVYLPSSLDGAARRSLPVTADVRGRETVLLVEDQDAVRKVAARSLRRFGYVVLEASGAEEARALAAEPATVIDILLTDVVMPSGGGRALAEALALSRPGLRVLYMSGHTDDVVLRAAIDAGMPFVQKPFSVDTLAREVRRVLDA
jgi:CheY-like chemotaxis protein